MDSRRIIRTSSGVNRIGKVKVSWAGEPNGGGGKSSRRHMGQVLFSANQVLRQARPKMCEQGSCTGTSGATWVSYVAKQMLHFRSSGARSSTKSWGRLSQKKLCCGSDIVRRDWHQKRPFQKALLKWLLWFHGCCDSPMVF